MQSFIECKKVDYVSSRTEAFYDIQLNIKSNHNSMYYWSPSGFILLFFILQLNCVYNIFAAYVSQLWYNSTWRL